MNSPNIHFSFPVVLVVLHTLFGINDPDINYFYAFIVGLFFFCFPYVCWAAIQKYAPPSHSISHAGYIGASFALLIIVSHPPNSMGLLNQWLEYWRLAFMLMYAGVGSAFAIHWRYS